MCRAGRETLLTHPHVSLTIFWHRSSNKSFSIQSNWTSGPVKENPQVLINDVVNYIPVYLFKSRSLQPRYQIRFFPWSVCPTTETALGMFRTLWLIRLLLVDGNVCSIFPLWCLIIIIISIKIVHKVHT